MDSQETSNDQFEKYKSKKERKREMYICITVRNKRERERERERECVCVCVCVLLVPFLPIVQVIVLGCVSLVNDYETWPSTLNQLKIEMT